MNFDPVETPIEKGLTLLDASAGTGKTYSLVRIIARHLVEDQIPLDQLLTVTFTKAATAEIKTRLHGLLHEVLTELGTGEEPENDLAKKWYEKGKEEVEEIRKTLALALTTYDAVPIFTIDGFFQRLLKDYAFESNSLFSVELETDEAGLLDLALRDFWRAQVYGFSPEEYAAFQQNVGTFDEVRRFISEILRSPDAVMAAEYSACAEDLITEQERSFQAVRKVLVEHEEGLREFVSNPPAGLKKNVNPFRSSGVKQFSEFIDGIVSEVPLCVLNFKITERLSPDYLTSVEAFNKGKHQDLSGHPLMPVFQKISEYNNLPTPDLKSAYLGDLLSSVKEQLAKIKEERNVQMYGDVTQKLATLLSSDSPAAQTMIRSVRQTYRAALIDEFQDTSPQQCAIFLSLFHYPEGSFHIVGDPKQSIYRFRGADVFAYINARAVADHERSLKTNYRSTPEMIHAVNQIFQYAEDPFIVDGKIQFQPSGWEGKEGGDPSAETPSVYIHAVDPELKNKPSYTGAITAHICSEILSLIGRPWGEINPHDRERENPVSPADIALLVSTGKEGKELYNHLTALGIPAVTQTKTSLLETEDARDLYVILKAALSPNKPALVRSALLTKALRRNSDLNEEAAFLKATECFAELKGVWDEKGVMPMFHLLCDYFSLHQSLLSQPKGLRSHTNLLHLVELLDRKAREEHASPEDSARWLEMAVDGTILETEAETLELRLDTDRPAVKILTQHACKGLEFPIVFITPPCPREFNNKIPPDLSYHGEDGETYIAAQGEALSEKRIQEACADRVRLAYVALTRAEALCHFYYVPPNYVHRQNEHAVFRMLGGPSLAELRDLAEQSNGCISVEELPAMEFPEAVQMESAESETLELRSRSLAQTDLVTKTRTTSFTGLSKHHHGTYTPPLKEPETGSPPEPLVSTEAEFWSRLKAGATLGTTFHEILEELDFTTLEGVEKIIREKLNKYQPYALGFKPDTELDPLVQKISTYLSEMLTTPLGEGEGCLNTVPRADCLIEPEFLLTSSNYSLQKLATVLEESPPEGVPQNYAETLAQLEISDFTGYLSGFVDLVFLADGKYHILDWKTNRLEDYTAGSLREAMARSHYYLQYHLYTLALDRFLQSRLGESYDAETHLGSVYYVFLRGVQPGVPGSGVFSDTLSPARLQKLRNTYLPE